MRVAAAVGELAHAAAAAAVPGAVDAAVEAVLLAGDRADRRARRARERPPVGIGERVAVLVDGLAPFVDQPAEIVDALAVLRPQRQAALVDPGQAGGMRARVGRVDVPAEVVRLGLAGLDERARAGHRHHAGAHSGQEPAPRRGRGELVGGARGRGATRHGVRPRCGARRRSAAASTVSSWAPELNVPFASTVPSAPTATANGLPGTSASAHASASSTSSKRRSSTTGWRPNASIVGASAWQMWQLSDVKTASEIFA